MPELTAESLVSENTVGVTPDGSSLDGGRAFLKCHPDTRVSCVCLLGSGRQQPVLLEKLVFLYQSAENIEQADQVETLPNNGESFF